MRYFKKEEFVCKCGCGRVEIDTELASKLDDARARFGSPMKLSSGYRCKVHNKNVGGKPGSYHTQGKAVDIICTNSTDRFFLVTSLLAAGFRRIGIGKDFIHADVGDFPLGVLFTYY